MNITFIHLYNNYSGSPKVLEMVIKEYIENGYNVELVVNKTEGFLSDIEDVKYNYIDYKWSENKLKTLIYFIYAQLQLFIKILFSKSHKSDTIYVNTILPFAAVLAGKLRNMELIYHVHERYINPNLINRLCEYIHEKSKVKSIFVSHYLKDTYKDLDAKTKVIYNKIDSDFQKIAYKYDTVDKRVNNEILLIASLRKYKGIYEFVELCDKLPTLKFNLILSGVNYDIENFKSRLTSKRNLNIYANKTDLHPFYQKAKVVLNLSRIDEWIETFGLTILEAMTYGIPTIVPPVGGPIELVQNNINGYLIDSNDTNKIAETILELFSDNENYLRLSSNAYNKSLAFNNRSLFEEIQTFIHTK